MVIEVFTSALNVRSRVNKEIFLRIVKEKGTKDVSVPDEGTVGANNRLEEEADIGYSPTNVIIGVVLVVGNIKILFDRLVISVLLVA